MELQTPRCKCPGNTRWEQSFGEESRAVLDRDLPEASQPNWKSSKVCQSRSPNLPEKHSFFPGTGKPSGWRSTSLLSDRLAQMSPVEAAQGKLWVGGGVAESFWMHCFVGNVSWFWRPGGVVYSPIKGWEDKQNGISPYGAVTQLQSHETDVSMETALLEWSQLFKQLE